LGAGQHSIHSMNRNTLYFRLSLICLAVLIGGFAFVLMH
jgi:hypothetical protein